MNQQNFPLIACGLGAVLTVIVIMGSAVRGDDATTLPLFTLLAMCEFAFFVTAIGAFLGIRQMRSGGTGPGHSLVATGCILFAVHFVWRGLALWPG